MRSKIFQMVDAIVPLDDMEEAHISFTKKWIVSGAEIFRIAKPAMPDPHLVAYFLLIDQLAGKVLLVNHKKAGLWLPAGGHVEINEHPKATVQRELMEELGVEPDFIAYDPVSLTVTKTVGETAGHTDVSLWYILRGSSDQNYEFDPKEFMQIQWFQPEEISFDQADPHLKRCIQKLKFLKVLT
jgi:8-oxo-dGTP pyrophosphatase MutT (NUDIX family)